jgi:hypothetical protein
VNVPGFTFSVQGAKGPGKDLCLPFSKKTSKKRKGILSGANLSVCYLIYCNFVPIKRYLYVDKTLTAFYNM